MTTSNLNFYQKIFKTMNWIIIIGIVIIALGTFLIYYGSSLSSSKDKKEIKGYIDSVNQNINQIQADNIPQAEKEEKIKKIESEFDLWAKQFIHSKEGKRIAFDKNEISLRELKDKLNNQWRELYVKFFTSISQMIKAFNQATGKSIILLKENPNLPINIYDAKPENFKVIIQFNSNVYWNIWLKISEPIEEPKIPSINIEVTDQPIFRPYAFGDIRFSINTENKKVYVDCFKSFEKAGFKREYSLDAEANQMTILLKKAFEFQILVIEK